MILPREREANGIAADTGICWLLCFGSSYLRSPELTLPISSRYAGHMAIAFVLLAAATVSAADSDIHDSKGTCALQVQRKLADHSVKYTPCGVDEMSCWDSVSMMSTCHPKTAGCPVTCPAGEQMCHMPVQYEGGEAMNSCQSSAYPCPVYCSMNETMCYDSLTMLNTCHPKSTGCPVTCSPSEHMCHQPPTYPGGDAWNYCSPLTMPCLLRCWWTHMLRDCSGWFIGKRMPPQDGRLSCDMSCWRTDVSHASSVWRRWSNEFLSIFSLPMPSVLQHEWDHVLWFSNDAEHLPSQKHRLSCDMQSLWAYVPSTTDISRGRRLELLFALTMPCLLRCWWTHMFTWLQRMVRR